IVRGVSILAGGFGHAEVITKRPAWEIEDWYEGLIREIAEAKRIYIELIDRLSTDKYPTKHITLNRADACSTYGGCPYLNVCKARDPLSWIPTNFEYHHWDPVTRTSTDIPYTEF